MCKIKKSKVQKGITLIALIITIVVLLVLAVVAVGTIRDSGIIRHAQSAKTEYEIAQEKENIQLALSEAIVEGNGKVTKANLESALNEIFKDNIEYTDTTSSEDFIQVKIKSSGREYKVYLNGTIEGPIESGGGNSPDEGGDSDLPDGSDDGNNEESYIASYTDDGVPIPIGFKYVEGTKGTGVVIENETEGSQFVWVPVTTDIVAYGLETSNKREPDVITGVTPSDTVDSASGTSNDAQQTNLTSAGCTKDLNRDGYRDAYDFKKQLENEFNAMTTSVNEYDGFYVGRYETSVSSTGVAQSKGSTDDNLITPANASTNSTWYGLYALNKTYNTNSVQSSLIWGSQYDAMMSWMGTAATSAASASSGTSANGTGYTGYDENDVINNVYDLYGNNYEYTMEASAGGVRTNRGGAMGKTLAPNYSCTVWGVTTANIKLGSRLALYIGAGLTYEEDNEDQNGKDDSTLPVATVGTIVNENSTINGEIYSSTNPVIPAGFMPIDTATSSWNAESGPEVTKGLVISDGISEFVWIPVSNLNSFARLQDSSAENYRGVLYDWDTDSSGNTEYNWSSTGTGSREPSNIVATYDNTSYMSIWTETLYQKSFNKMVKSVSKYGGFYVGRYETSLSGGIAQSKSGEITMYNIDWYKMYEYSLTYSSSRPNLGVTSEMIWGCQWDAMLKFILTGDDASHVTLTSNAGHISSEFTSKPYRTGGTNYLEVYEGSVTYNDIASNIYDLEGNVNENTQEAYDTNQRVYRGR